MPIVMMGEERFAVAVADAYSRVTAGKQIGVCTVMANLNAAGIQMAFGAIAQAWEDSSPLLVIAEGVSRGASRHTHFDMAEALKSVTKWVGKIDQAELVPDYVRRAFTHLRSGRPGPGPADPPARPRRVRRGRAPVHAGQGLALRPRSRRRQGGGQGAAGGEGPAALRRRGRLLRRRHRRAPAVRRAGPGAGADHAQGEERPPGEPSAVARRARLAGRALHEQVRPASSRSGPSLFPNRFSHAIPDADKKTIVQCTVDTLDLNRSYETKLRRDRRRQADAAGADRGAVGADRRRAAKKPGAAGRDQRRPGGVPGEVPPAGWSRTSSRSTRTGCSAI